MDPTLIDDTVGLERGQVRAPFEEYVSFLSRRGFAWLVVAAPERADAIAAEASKLRREIVQAESRADRSEEERVVVDAKRARYRELVRARGAGIWNIHVLVGGSSAEEARQTAALLCSGSDLGALPYALIPESESAEFDVTLSADLPSTDAGSSPFLASTDLLVSIARVPELELPGIRTATVPAFDTTPESTARGTGDDGGGHVPLGMVLDQNLESAEPVSISPRTINKHVFVCGATGSGKSQTVRTLLEGLTKRDEPVPWMVIEPAKAEYAGMVGRLGEDRSVLVLRPGDPRLIPASLNPLEPAPGFSLQSHLDLVRALFLAAFEADEPFPQVLSQALTRCYERYGWDLATGEAKPTWTDRSDRQPGYPTLDTLERECRQVVIDVGYSDQVRDNVLGFIAVRIGSLRLGSPGRFLQGGHPLSFEELLGRNVVVEIEGISNDQDKAFVMGVVLIRLVEHLRVRGPSDELRHVLVIEEAHRLLKNITSESSRGMAQAVEFFASLLAEVRAYGEGLIVAEQIPSKIIPDVIKNTALKVLHRLPAADDRLSVGATMNLTPEQSEYVVSLPPGRAAVFADEMDRPLLVHMPDRKRDEGGLPEDVPPLQPGQRRSWACPKVCLEHACDLQQIRDASRLIDDHPHLILWAEILLLAHVMGWRGHPFGKPPDSWFAWLTHGKPNESRTLECAIADVVQNSVADRYRYLVEFYPPEEFASHLTLAIGQGLSASTKSRGAACDETDVRWAAGNRRYADVLAALQDDTIDRTSPHPQTTRWRDDRGLHLPGTTRDQQLAALRAHPWTRYPYQLDLYRGAARRPAFEEVAMRLVPSPSPRESLGACLDAFQKQKSRDYLIQTLYRDPPTAASAS